MIGSIMAIALRPTPISVAPNIAKIARSLRFGAWVTTSRSRGTRTATLIAYFIGRMVGEAALGAYTIAATFASLPVEKITPLYARVLESVIAHVQSDRAAVARYFLNITEGVAMLGFPLGVGLALVADQFVMALLGAHWEAAILPMQLLALGAVTRALDPPLAQVLVATGHARENARSMMIAAAVLPDRVLCGRLLRLGSGRHRARLASRASGHRHDATSLGGACASPSRRCPHTYAHCGRLSAPPRSWLSPSPVRIALPPLPPGLSLAIRHHRPSRLPRVALDAAPRARARSDGFVRGR